MSAIQTTEIKKLRLQETVLFAINHIPQAHATTLKQFLELVNAGGSFGTVSHEEILRKMYLLLKYIPNASVSSLLILIDLLDIKPSKRFVLEATHDRRSKPDEAKDEGEPFFISSATPKYSVSAA
jgi:hypothetical protein